MAAQRQGQDSTGQKGSNAGGVSSVLARNIAMLAERRRVQEEEAPLADRLASTIATFTGSMRFVLIHVVVFSVWVFANLGLLPPLPVWDGNFIILGTSASIEAIFLSTFILITQNRMAELDSKRADLDVQISLLAEHEISRLAALTSAIAVKLGVEIPVDEEELQEITRDVVPDRVLDQIEDPPETGTTGTPGR